MSPSEEWSDSNNLFTCFQTKQGQGVTDVNLVTVVVGGGAVFIILETQIGDLSKRKGILRADAVENDADAVGYSCPFAVLA